MPAAQRHDWNDLAAEDVGPRHRGCAVGADPLDHLQDMLRPRRADRMTMIPSGLNCCSSAIRRRRRRRLAAAASIGPHVAFGAGLAAGLFSIKGLRPRLASPRKFSLASQLSPIERNLTKLLCCI